MLFFISAAIILALADWIAVSRQASQLRWITKPGAMLALLLWFTTSTPSGDDPRITWFTLALCFSLVGDIFLLMEGHQLIKGGLAFILAHLAFIAAYNTPFQFSTASVFLLVITSIPSFLTFRKISHTIALQGDQDLAYGVWVYAAALTLMTSTALSIPFKAGWPSFAAGLTALGGFLFYISDLGLFFHRLIKPSPAIHVLSIITYHAAQFALTYSFLWYLYQ